MPGAGNDIWHEGAFFTKEQIRQPLCAMGSENLKRLRPACTLIPAGEVKGGKVSGVVKVVMGEE
jgi:hypothetical protein